MRSCCPTNHKGALAEMKVATEAFEAGVPVLRPMQEHGRYDLAFEIGRAAAQGAGASGAR